MDTGIAPHRPCMASSARSRAGSAQPGVNLASGCAARRPSTAERASKGGPSFFYRVHPKEPGLISSTLCPVWRREVEGCGPPTSTSPLFVAQLDHPQAHWFAPVASVPVRAEIPRPARLRNRSPRGPPAGQGSPPLVVGRGGRCRGAAASARVAAMMVSAQDHDVGSLSVVSCPARPESGGCGSTDGLLSGDAGLAARSAWPRFNPSR